MKRKEQELHLTGLQAHVIEFVRNERTLQEKVKDGAFAEDGP